MFSQTTEYALRAVVHLAQNVGTAQTTRQIADATHVPQGYLSKILQTLVRAQLIKSQRGLGGGFVLERTPAEITIFEIVEIIDPIPRITYCPLGLQAHGTHLCALHHRMDQAILGVLEAFRSSTLQELLDEPNRSRPLCADPDQKCGQAAGSNQDTSMGGRDELSAALEPDLEV